MLNYLWGGMIIFSMFTAFFGGHMQQMTQSILESSQSAVEICISSCGALAMWMGIMRIAENAHLIDALANRMTPILNFLFPDVPHDHPARKYIATNLIANFLGLGWAATPPGLKAMQELQKLNKTHPQVATHAMCMFLIVNISTVQLISINIIAYRSAYGSANPTEIIGPSIVATALSTFVAITFAKCMYRRND